MAAGNRQPQTTAQRAIEREQQQAKLNLHRRGRRVLSDTFFFRSPSLPTETTAPTAASHHFPLGSSEI